MKEYDTLWWLGRNEALELSRTSSTSVCAQVSSDANESPIHPVATTDFVRSSPYPPLANLVDQERLSREELLSLLIAEQQRRIAEEQRRIAEEQRRVLEQKRSDELSVFANALLEFNFWPSLLYGKWIEDSVFQLEAAVAGIDREDDEALLSALSSFLRNLKPPHPKTVLVSKLPKSKNRIPAIFTEATSPVYSSKAAEYFLATFAKENYWKMLMLKEIQATAAVGWISELVTV